MNARAAPPSHVRHAEFRLCEFAWPTIPCRGRVVPTLARFPKNVLLWEHQDNEIQVLKSFVNSTCRVDGGSRRLRRAQMLRRSQPLSVFATAP